MAVWLQSDEQSKTQDLNWSITRIVSFFPEKNNVNYFKLLKMFLETSVLLLHELKLSTFQPEHTNAS